MGIAVENPSIIGLSFLVALMGSASYLFGNILLQYLTIFILFPVSYFFMAGLYTLAVQAQTGKVAEWQAVFIEGGKRKWISLLLGGLFFAAAMMLFTLASELLFIIAAFILGGAAYFIGGLFNKIVGLALMALILLIITPLFFGLTAGLFMFLQFFDIGIVAGDYGVIRSFKESFNFTRERFNAVLGYTVVKYLALFILSIPLTPFFLAYFKEAFTNPAALYPSISMVGRFGPVFLLGSVLVGTLAAAFTYSYHTTFYVQNMGLKRERESILRILVKLYGAGLIVLVVLGIFAGLIAYLYAPLFQTSQLERWSFHEDFEGIPVGTYPAIKGWKNQYSGQSAYVTNLIAHGGGNSLMLDGEPYWARTDYMVVTQSDRVSYEAYVYLPERSDVRIGFTVARGNMNPFYNNIRFHRDGVIRFNGLQTTELQPYNTRRWYKIRVELDYDRGAANVYVDDVMRAEDVPIQPIEFYDSKGRYTVLDKFGLSAGGYGREAIVYFDDITFQTEDV
ncbi:MAG: hypothetical protein D6733_03520 [Methanobacteriota archaeon]|nr:MAG: hypothetical protein D6733_03520 [Euryarchaeota archaeon]